MALAVPTEQLGSDLNQPAPIVAPQGLLASPSGRHVRTEQGGDPVAHAPMEPSPSGRHVRTEQGGGPRVPQPDDRVTIGF